MAGRSGGLLAWLLPTTSSAVLLLLSLTPCTGAPDYSAMRHCPFPAPDTLQPCSCLVDTQYNTHLVCSLQQDFTTETLEMLNRAYRCKKKVSFIDINLNGNGWISDLNSELTGEFEMGSFKLRNFSSFSGDISAGAFNNSKFSMKEFILDSATDGSGNNTIQTGAFTNLVNLRKVEFGNSFSKINTSSFVNLPRLEMLNIGDETLELIESGAFHNIGLTKIDFSQQRLKEIPPRAFKDFPNAVEIDLSGNQITRLSEDSFSNLPKVVSLDLSNNAIEDISNTLSKLTNQNLQVDLSNNQIEFIMEESFKPYIETSKGKVNLFGNPIQVK